MNYFTDDELKCKCCGVNKFNNRTLRRLNNLRATLGRAITLSSAYRCKAYNLKIGATQTHATGQAVDIAVSGLNAYKLLDKALEMGFSGIGIQQKGDHKKRFIHLDTLQEDLEIGRPRPHVWSY